MPNTPRSRNSGSRPQPRGITQRRAGRFENRLGCLRQRPASLLPLHAGSSGTLRARFEVANEVCAVHAVSIFCPRRCSWRPANAVLLRWIPRSSVKLRARADARLTQKVQLTNSRLTRRESRDAREAKLSVAIAHICRRSDAREATAAVRALVPPQSIPRPAEPISLAEASSPSSVRSIRSAADSNRIATNLDARTNSASVFDAMKRE